MTHGRTYILLTVLAIFVGLLSTGLFLWVPDLNNTYTSKLQTPLFTGFLTLGSFLLTLKIFIVVQLKEKLYDSDAYINNIANLRLQNDKLDVYAPLERLADLLLSAVISALTTALLQLTLGFVGKQITSAICFSFAVGTLLLVFFVWWQIRRNIYDLFDYASKTQEPKIEKRQAEILAQAKRDA